jgi:succinoglycan biosynthesis transport protein ExoP
MDEPLTGPEIHLRDYLKIVQKRLWLSIAFFVIVVTLTALSVSRQVPIYQATSRLQIDRERPKVLQFQEVVEADNTYGDEYYQTQYELLRSRSLALEVIGKLNLASNPFFGGSAIRAQSIAGSLAALARRSDEGRPSADASLPPQDAATTRIISQFLGSIQISPLRNTRLVDIRAVSINPKLATDMANALAVAFIERNQRIRRTTTREATDWLSTEVEDARAKVEAAEQALQKYKEKSDIVAPQDRENMVVQKLDELNSILTKAKTDRIGLEIRYQQMLKVANTPELFDTLPEVLANPIVQDLKRQANQLQLELSQLSKAYTPKHPRIIALTSQIEAMQKKIKSEIVNVTKSIRNEYDVARAKEQSLQQAVDQQKREVQGLSQKSIQYSVYLRDVENARRMYDILLNRAKETGLSEGLQTDNIRIVDRAEIPLSPIGPRKVRSLLLAVLVGLAGGIGLAFFFEYIDDSIKDPDDLEHYVQLPFLAAVGIIKPKNKTHSKDFIADQEPKSPFAEAYRSARTSIIFSSPDSQPVIIMVTSAGPGEGKTTTALNLAITFAHSGNRTVVIDADLRKPRVHGVFKLANTFGLTNLLAESTDLPKAIHGTQVKNLDVMPSGPIPPNPSELLGSHRMRKLLDALRRRYDRIIIDCPPVITVTDASILATSADGVVVVVKAGKTTRQILRRTKKKLEEVRARIFGVVLNELNIQKSRYYYYYPNYYQAYYGDEKEGKRKTRP